MAMCSNPFASAKSVPGIGARCSPAPSAVEVRRGSTTMCRAPAARPRSKYCIAGGMVSAGLAPTSRIACAFAMSDSGNGSPRSTPKARLPAVADDDMQKRPL